MDTVAKPEIGSVEYYADLYRRGAPAEQYVVYCMTGAIQSIVESAIRTDAEKVEQVRNAIAAGGLVRAEMRAVR